MNCKAILILLCFVIIITTTPSDNCMAFKYYGHTWCCDTVYYHINPASPINYCGNPITDSMFLAQVMQAAEIWNVEGTNFQLIFSDTTSASCIKYDTEPGCFGRKDGQNTVSMSSGCDWGDDNVLAYASWWYHPDGYSSCCIYEADICFNENNDWFCFGGCSGDCYDLFSVAAHEFGHWISGGHEEHKEDLGYEPLMYPYIGSCEFTRELTLDDKALLSHAYSAWGNISLPNRCQELHKHPPYGRQSLYDECQECPPGIFGCMDIFFNTCLNVCPADDIIFTVRAEDQCHDPICDLENIYLDFTNCNATAPEELESHWPIVYPDSCEPGTGMHYFSISAGLLDCNFCSAMIRINGNTCANLHTRFMDNNGDLQVTSSDFVGGRDCEDYDCNGILAENDRTIWDNHYNHSYLENCDCAPGETNGDGKITVGDAVFLVFHIFRGGDPPEPYEVCTGDANCNCALNIADAVFLINTVFRGGDLPCACTTWFSRCGPLRK